MFVEGLFLDEVHAAKGRRKRQYGSLNIATVAKRRSLIEVARGTRGVHTLEIVR